jgi:hypothetical protein
MSVDTRSETLVTGRAVALFLTGGDGIGWTVSPDGQTFVIPQSARRGGQPVRLLTNWRARLP